MYGTVLCSSFGILLDLLLYDPFLFPYSHPFSLRSPSPPAGQKAIRPYWANYYENTDAIVSIWMGIPPFFLSLFAPALHHSHPLHLSFPFFLLTFRFIDLRHRQCRSPSC